MARPRDLNNVEEVREIVNRYLQTDRPTQSGLARMLRIHRDTLYRNIDREDDIGDILMDAYLYIVQKHEEHLYDSSCGGSIFYLKTLKKHFTFKENDEVINKPIDLTFRIIDKREENTDDN
jgi:hypothetical protein